MVKINKCNIFFKCCSNTLNPFIMECKSVIKIIILSLIIILTSLYGSMYYDYISIIKNTKHDINGYVGYLKLGSVTIFTIIILLAFITSMILSIILLMRFINDLFNKYKETEKDMWDFYHIK